VFGIAVALFARRLQQNTLVFTPSLRSASYGRAMRGETQRVGGRGDGSRRSASDGGDRMSRWRWLLFAAMARFEVSEEIYLRIPTANLPPPKHSLWRALSKVRRRWPR
jgi:hypothetical protein